MDGSVRLDLSPTIDAGKASTILNESTLQKMIELAKPNSSGHKTIRIQLLSDPASDVKEYQVILPASAFRAGTSTLQLELTSSLATIMLPNRIFPENMLDNVKTVTLLLRTVDAAGQLKGKLGNRSLIEYELRLDGTKAQMNNLQTAIQIGLPHPAVVPASNNAFIVVWNVDTNGFILPVIGEYYDAVKKQAMFSTTNSSGQFAAVYNHKTFSDLSDSHWAKFVVEVLTSKGVITGVSEQEFKPDQAITRADFVLLLVRTLELTAVDGIVFSDVSPSDYFYEGLMTAQKLGIVNGQTDGRYHPHESISRQEMFVMVVRALKAAGKLSPVPASSSPLVVFTDHNQIAEYAAEDIAELVAAGFIKGNGQQQLTPTAPSSRAEAAMLIYRILMQK